MKEFFNRLNPMERRFVVGVAVAFFLVINVVWVFPRFGDWSATRTAMDDAQGRLNMFQDGIGHMRDVQNAISKYQNQNQVVPPEDQAVQFFRLIVNQSSASGVAIIYSGSPRQSQLTNNSFFMEQNQTITTQSGEKQLVDFLYNLGNGNSFIRVKDLSVQPDPPHQALSARITLVASYQKKTPGPGTAAPAPAAAKTPAPASAPAKTPAAPASPKPTTPSPASAAAKPAATKPIPPNPAGGPNPRQPWPLNNAATNKLNPLTPNKR
jgi:hypothetical protein